MLKLSTNVLELRGVQTKVSKKGTTYYVLLTEDVDTSEPYQFFVRDFSAIPPGLKKGDLITVIVCYNSFKELQVIEVVHEK